MDRIPNPALRHLSDTDLRAELARRERQRQADIAEGKNPWGLVEGDIFSLNQGCRDLFVVTKLKGGNHIIDAQKFVEKRTDLKFYQDNGSQYGFYLLDGTEMGDPYDPPPNPAKIKAKVGSLTGSFDPALVTPEQAISLGLSGIYPASIRTETPEEMYGP